MPLTIAVAILLAVTLLYTLFIRAKDIPPPDPVSPTQHLDERKATIYENLRDLQFEFRLGKLSDEDYAKTKLALQKELAVVVRARNSIVAAWLWRRNADTSLGGNAIRVDAMCGIVEVSGAQGLC